MCRKRCLDTKKGRCTSCLLHMKRLPPAAVQQNTSCLKQACLTSARRQATVNHRGVTFSIARTLQILQCILLQRLYAHSKGDRINLTQKLFVLGWLTRRWRSVKSSVWRQAKTEQRLGVYVTISDYKTIALYLTSEDGREAKSVKREE